MTSKKQSAEKKTLKSKQVAEAIGTDARTLRMFLRASDDYQAVGAGKRYAFQESDIPTMKKRFNTWKAAQDEARKKRSEEAQQARATDDDTTTPQQSKPDDDVPQDVDAAEQEPTDDETGDVSTDSEEIEVEQAPAPKTRTRRVQKSKAAA